MQSSFDSTVSWLLRSSAVYTFPVCRGAATPIGRFPIAARAKYADDPQEATQLARAKKDKAATKLVSGTPITDTTVGAVDRFASEKCGGNVWSQASGDKVYQFTLKERSKVNLTLKNSFYNAIMSLRQDCGDPTRNEIVCSSYYNKTIDRELEPGTYYVVVDGFGVKSEGAYTIEMTAKSVK